MCTRNDVSVLCHIIMMIQATNVQKPNVHFSHHQSALRENLLLPIGAFDCEQIYTNIKKIPLDPNPRILRHFTVKYSKKLDDK